MKKSILCFVFLALATTMWAQTGSTKKKTTKDLIDPIDKTIYTYTTDEEYIEKAKKDLEVSFATGELRQFTIDKKINSGKLNFKITLGAKNRIIGIFVEENEGVSPTNSNSFKDYLQYNAKFYFKMPKDKMIKFNQLFIFN